MKRIANDSKPLYLKVKEAIEESIKQEIYKPGDRLDSEAQLSDEFGVSRATLREALRILEKEGKIRRKQGVGTFITEKATLFKSGIEELSSITKTIEAMGLNAGTIDKNFYLEKQEIHLTKEFNLTKNQNIVVMERTRTADDEPVAYCKDHIPEKILSLESINEQNFESLLDLLENEKGIHITYAVADIIPVQANEFLQEKLRIDKENPLLLLKQMHYNDLDKPILYSQNYFRSDKFEFHVVRNREY